MILKPGDRIRLGAAEAGVLFTQRQIESRLKEIAASLRDRLGSENPIFIALLNGGFVFVSDLIRAFDAPHEVDFLKFSRYDTHQKDRTAVRVMHDLRSNIRDRTVVVVEGIRARGTKVEYVRRFLELHRPGRLEFCAMIRPAGANVEVPIDEAGFDIGSEYVVGYGLDYREQYRNLPFICAIDVAEPGAPPVALQGAA